MTEGQEGPEARSFSSSIEVRPLWVPVDAHVHVHTLNNVAATLASAEANFRAFVPRESGVVGVLLLTQASAERVFEQIIGHSHIDDWAIETCSEEPQSLLVGRGERSMVMICGRQIRCERGLEVAALGTTAEFPAGEPIREAIARVQGAGVFTVLPWGFGKWTGRRAKLVRQILEQPARGLSVGDNGGRMALMGEPLLIRAARERGYLVLPGSDPFPFGGDYRRVGAFGFLAELRPDTSAPWRQLRRWLESQQHSPPAYGRALGPVRVLFNNVGIRLHNRLKERWR